jgi:molecular chaperone HtpG
VLEVNPAHPQIERLAALPESDELRTDAAHLLLDEARIVDGEPPRDPRAFAERLARLIARATA